MGASASRQRTRWVACRAIAPQAADQFRGSFQRNCQLFLSYTHGESLWSDHQVEQLIGRASDYDDVIAAQAIWDGSGCYASDGPHCGVENGGGLLIVPKIGGPHDNADRNLVGHLAGQSQINRA
ncbi:hypothetical protein FQV39_13815 [Bosea sp. F3-2]|uniref:hypothetical protein n=1 Tax=Bosea sp. F3-2 TaxID=2599640 RepID=UPI0011EFD324|nr:hypothetical protein [Bosea sp. F3-2]QEL23538.1 hypothetical protein FQV39_13815 [Bosea sp. F3-2]